MSEAKQIQALEREKIPKLLFHYALPAVVGTMVNSLYNIIDRIFIGHGVSEFALAGLAITFPILIFMQAFGMLVGAGASVRISIVLGQRNYKGAERVLGNAAILTLITQVLVLVPCFIYMEPLLKLFGASERTLPYAIEYLQVVIPANILATMSFGYNAIMRSSGYPRKAMTTMIIGATLNIILDWLFIYPLQMGIRGAAIATAIAMTVSSAYVMAHFFDRNSIVRFRRHAFKPSFKIMLSIFTIGVSPFSMQLAGTMVMILMNRSFVRYGGGGELSDLAIGTFGIINSYAMLLVMFALGIAQGMQPIVGFNYGAMHFRRTWNTYKLGCKVNLSATMIGWLLAMAFPSVIVGMFTSSPQLIEISTKALRITFAVFGLIGFQITTTQFFQSMGFSGKAMFLSLTRQVIFLIPSLLILPRCLGLDGVWWSLPISDLASVLMAMLLISLHMRRLLRFDDTARYRPKRHAPKAMPKSEQT